MSRTPSGAGFHEVAETVGGGAARAWWDENATEYLAEHGDFLGPADFCW